MQEDEVSLIDLNPGSASSSPSTSAVIEFKGSVYLPAIGTSGMELFRVDGTNATEFDLYPGAKGSYPRSFVEFNGELFFSALGPNGRGVYRTNGTAIEEVFNPELRPPESTVDPRISALVPLGNSLIFIAESSQGSHLYRITVPELESLLLMFFFALAISRRQRLEV